MEKKAEKQTDVWEPPEFHPLVCSWTCPFHKVGEHGICNCKRWLERKVAAGLWDTMLVQIREVTVIFQSQIKKAIWSFRARDVYFSSRIMRHFFTALPPPLLPSLLYLLYFLFLSSSSSFISFVLRWEGDGSAVRNKEDLSSMDRGLLSEGGTEKSPTTVENFKLTYSFEFMFMCTKMLICSEYAYFAFHIHTHTHTHTYSYTHILSHPDPHHILIYTQTHNLPQTKHTDYMDTLMREHTIYVCVLWRSLCLSTYLNREGMSTFIWGVCMCVCVSFLFHLFQRSCEMKVHAVGVSAHFMISSMSIIVVIDVIIMH